MIKFGKCYIRIISLENSIPGVYFKMILLVNLRVLDFGLEI